MRQLLQSGVALIMLYINQETSTSAFMIKEINAFNILKFKQLSEYYKKNLKKHLNFFCSTNTLFNINTLYFLTERLKIYFTMQYFKKKSQNMWYNKLKGLKEFKLIKKMIFKNFKQFLLNFVKNFINHQLHHAQLH